VTVSWFRPQNQADFGLSVAPQNRWREDGTEHVSRSSGLLRVEASRAKVFQSDLKTGGCAIAGGARGTIMEVALRSSRRQTGQCDGLCQTLLPLLCRLCPRAYMVFPGRYLLGKHWSASVLSVLTWIPCSLVLLSALQRIPCTRDRLLLSCFLLSSASAPGFHMGLSLPVEFPPCHWFSPSSLQQVVAARASTVSSYFVGAPHCLLIQAHGPAPVLLTVGVSFCYGWRFIKIQFFSRNLVFVSLQGEAGIPLESPD
jgi:hypothetical protein